MLAVSMSQKLFSDKFLGERFCECIGTLGGACRLIIGVTTSEVMVRWLCIKC
jgi:hypothetical protein